MHIALLLLACRGPEEAAVPAPELAIDAAGLTFGDVVVGGTDVATLAVRNAGTGALAVRSVAVIGDDAFTVAEVPAEVAPGDEGAIHVVYAPVARGASAGFLEIRTDDADRPTVSVPLAGAGVQGALGVEPTALDLGDVPLGCEGGAPLTITNAGDAALVIEAVTADGADGLTVDAALPLTLEAGASGTVNVTWAATEAGSMAGAVVVDSDAGEGSVAVAGAGVAGEGAVETFRVAETDTIDVVMAVGADGSMEDELARLLGEVSDLFAALDASGSDWRLAAVVADDGCVRGSRWIDGAMDPAERQERLTGMLDDVYAGTWTNAGLSLLEGATAAHNLAEGGCNEALLREGAALALLGVADVEEESPNPVAYSLALFRSFAPDVVVHAIAGADACAGTSPSARWAEAAAETGGTVTALCSGDWSPAWRALADGLHANGAFRLSGVPVPETLAVTVSGAPAARGWTWDAAENRVVFDAGARPGPGEEVGVTYVPAEACTP